MPREIQLSLFEKTNLKTMTIEDSASNAGVSTATIRNWLKTGYLQYAGKGMVANDSFERFQKEISGREKLNRRANKSQKNSHNHVEVSSLYLDRIQNAGSGIEFLGTEYEHSLSDSYRNKEGIYYTPARIVDDLFRPGLKITEKSRFCDPCCGSGNFVMRALSLGFKAENIHAYDTDPVAVALTKRRIFEKTGFSSNHVMEADFLEVFQSHGIGRFDAIFTNPPWGRKIERKIREKIGGVVRAGASIDTCSLFFFACLEILSEDGILGLLLPESFFNIASFESARKRALEYKIARLIDYGKPFPDLLTKAQAVTLAKTRRIKNDPVVCENSGIESTRTAASFANNPKSIINLNCSQEDADAIAYVYSIPHVTLKNNASWGLGIVTGNNGKFIRDECSAGFMPVFRGADITDRGLKEPSCHIPSDLSLYQQVAPVELYTAKSKIIYRFITSRLRFACDTEKRFLLNSANMLIPDDDFPVKMPVLCDLLNSDFMNWLFRKIFNTHKILRADLESLPIHSRFLGGRKFVEAEYIDCLGLERNRRDGTFRIGR